MKRKFAISTILAVAALICMPQVANATYFWDQEGYLQPSVCRNRLSVEEAIKACELALRTREVRADYLPYVLSDLGNDYAILGKYGDALLYYDKAIEVSPRLAFLYRNRAEAYEQIGQFARAIDDYTAYLQIDPSKAYILNNRCWLRALQGQMLNVALDDCNKSLQLNSGNAYALDSRSLVLYRMGNYAAAIADATAALNANPKVAGSLYVRGLAKLKSGDATGGDADIAQAKQLDPSVADRYAGYSVKP